MTLRCCYFSDLHLESQDFRWPVPKADVLIVAGDTVVHANCRGYDGKDRSAVRFTPAKYFEIG